MGRRFASGFAALRPPADRVRQRRGPRASRPCSASAWSDDSAGTPMVCQRSWRPSGSWGSPTSRRSSRWASTSSTVLSRLGAAVHRRMAQLRPPPGALGGLRQRLQDPRPGLHGSVMGVQGALRQGLVYQGCRVLPYSWYEQTPLATRSQTRRRLPDASGPRSPSPCRCMPMGNSLLWTA